MSFNGEPKNPRLSIHNKYKRRLKSLSLSVDDFVRHAERKLDESVSGKIHKREEIEQIVAKAKELATLLPDHDDVLDCRPIRDDLLEMLEQASGQTEKILDKADSFFKSLSKEEWDEMIKTYNEEKT